MFTIGLVVAASTLQPASAFAQASPDRVTFNRDVLPILQKNCQTCHRPGEIGPMSFLTYESTRPWAKAMKEAVVTKKMPPWFADPRFGHFENERRLSDLDIKKIADWVDAGAPEGDPKDKPAAVRWNDGWNIKPDVVFEMPKPYTVPATGTIDYVYFLLPNKFTQDTWIMDAEVRPGNRSVAHHASVIIRPPGSQWMKDAKVGEAYIPPRKPEGQAIDNVPGSQANQQMEWFVGYVPGMYPQRYFYPERGAGRMIAAGSDVFIEMHYTANGKESQDQTKVGFVTAKEPPRKQLVNLMLIDFNFEIPPGAPNHPGHTWATLNEAVAFAGVIVDPKTDAKKLITMRQPAAPQN